MKTVAKEDDPTPRAAALRAHTQLDYIYRLIWAQQLDAYMVRGRWRIRRASLDAYLTKRAAREATQPKQQEEIPA